MIEAQEIYHREQSEPPRDIRGIVIQSDNVFRMIRNRDEMFSFIREPGPSLGKMIETAMEEVEPSKVEVAIYCEKTGCICFSWLNGKHLTLWKTETKPEETEAEAAFRLLGDLWPNPEVNSLTNMWTAEFDGETTHFFMTYVDHEYDIENGLWVKPGALSSFCLDRTTTAAFINAPSLVKLIRRGP